jgi:hypothetical protein
METKDLIFIKTTDLATIRKELLEKQNYICPITKEKLTVESAVVDHKHKQYKDQEIGKDGMGMIRGALHRQVNVLEGKISNSYTRLGLHKLDISLSDILRNLADYLEQETTNIVHPSELPKPRKITKTCYGKLVKKLKEEEYKNKLPEYPKSQLLTKALQELFEKYNVAVEYYK